MRKIFLRALLVFMVCTALVALTATFAQAAKEHTPKVGFVVKNGRWQRLSEGRDAGGPIEFTPQDKDGLDFFGDRFLNGVAKTKGGAVFWLAVQPGNDSPEYQFGPTGLYFYSEGTKTYSFLSTGEDKEAEADILGVEFGGDGQFIINCHSLSFALFTFPDLKRVFRIEDVGTAVWVDDRRFVFSRYEPDLGLEMASVHLFDTLSGETSVLKKATKTSSYRTGIWDDGISGRESEVLVEGSKNLINVTECSFKSEDDVKDFWEKCEFGYLTIEIPAPGSTR